MQTSFVNSAIQRTSPHHLEDRVLETWRTKEIVAKCQDRSASIKGESVIQEEAEVRCGSREKLQQALARGAVRLVKSGGLHLFQFPSAHTSIEEHVKKNVESVAETGGNSQIHDEMRDEGLTVVTSEVVPSCAQARGLANLLPTPALPSSGFPSPSGMPSQPLPLTGLPASGSSVLPLLPPSPSGSAIALPSSMGSLPDSGSSSSMMSAELLEQLKIKVKQAEVHHSCLANTVAHKICICNCGLG